MAESPERPSEQLTDEISHDHDPEYIREEIRHLLREGFISPESKPSEASPFEREVLRSVIQSLEASHKRLQEKFNWTWKMPFAALGVIAMAASIFFGVNLYSQHMTLSQVSETASQLRDEVAMSQSSRTAVEAAQNQLTNQLSELEEKYTVELKAAHNERSLAFAANRSALATIALIDRARDQLVTYRDPQRALEYAGQAQAELDRVRIRLGGVAPTPPLNGELSGASSGEVLASNEYAAMLRQLESSLWVVQAEAHLREGDWLEVQSVAQQILTSDCNCLEGYEYRALAHLHDASNRVRPFERREREKATESAVVDLTKYVADSDRHYGNLLLAIAHFDLGDYKDSFDRSDRFLVSYEPELRPRLSPGLRAQLEVARGWRSLAALMQEGQDDVQMNDICEIDVGAVGAIEGMLFERYLQHVMENRAELMSHDTRDHHRAEHVIGWICINMIRALQRARCADPCQGACGPGGGFSVEVALENGLRALTHVPPYSQDKSLGKEVDGRLHMQFAEIHVEERTYAMYVEEEVVERVYEQEVVTFEEIECEPDAEIPPRRYYKYEENRMTPALPGAVEDAPEPPPEPADVPANRAAIGGDGDFLIQLTNAKMTDGGASVTVMRGYSTANEFELRFYHLDGTAHGTDYYPRYAFNDAPIMDVTVTADELGVGEECGPLKVGAILLDVDQQPIGVSRRVPLQ